MTGGDTVSGKTSTASKTKYNAKAYDEIKVRVHKGEKETIRAYASSRGLSLNEFITKAIANEMNRAGT